VNGAPTVISVPTAFGSSGATIAPSIGATFATVTCTVADVLASPSLTVSRAA
jgi:hypothetical protein